MMWDSPWGRGYPGWHIECSAMSMKYLGEQFDVHCGGVDHIPVHHTNEIAQSEGATGKQWVRYWMHIEFLLKGSEKMSKSKGNFHTIGQLRENGYDPLDYRYFCLQAHYRSQLKYSEEALAGARRARKNLIEKTHLLNGSPSLQLETVSAPGKKYRRDFIRAMTADLNTPQGLAVLWNTVKADDIPDEEKKALLLDFDSVLGLDLENEKTDAADQISPQDQKLIQERESARKAKDYKRADEIRDLLKEKGIILKDGPEGTVWEIE
jgi:cysteinyl-tRNA synthetase